MAREARPLWDRDGPEKDDCGNLVERVFTGHGQVLLSCPCGCGQAWLEPAEFYEEPDPRDASWERRDMVNLYWRAGFTLQ